MAKPALKPVRTFKTAWFSKTARKAGITDDELREAIEQARNGQADDLGGGVFKKRLNKNRSRAILLAKGGRHWIYIYLFAKKDRANIEHDELTEFRRLATHYGELAEPQIAQLMENADLIEIHHDNEAKI